MNELAKYGIILGSEDNIISILTDDWYLECFVGKSVVVEIVSYKLESHPRFLDTITYYKVKSLDPKFKVYGWIFAKNIELLGDNEESIRMLYT